MASLSNLMLSLSKHADRVLGERGWSARPARPTPIDLGPVGRFRHTAAPLRGTAGRR